MPDVYQGDELPAFSLVDPDNRRPVDWEQRRRLLDELRAGAALQPEAAKLALIQRLLRAARARPGRRSRGATSRWTRAGVLRVRRGGEVLVAVAVRPGAVVRDVAVPAGMLAADPRGWARGLRLPAGVETSLGGSWTATGSPCSSGRSGRLSPPAARARRQGHGAPPAAATACSGSSWSQTKRKSMTPVSIVAWTPSTL